MSVFLCARVVVIADDGWCSVVAVLRAGRCGGRDAVQTPCGPSEREGYLLSGHVRPVL